MGFAIEDREPSQGTNNRGPFVANQHTESASEFREMFIAHCALRGIAFCEIGKPARKC
jgi:hypothetical protein